MSLDVGRAVREGVRRTMSRRGVGVVAIFLAVGVANAVVTHTFLDQYLLLVEQLAEQGQVTSPPAEQLPETPLAVPLPVSVGTALWIVGGLALALVVVSETTRILAVRLFYEDAHLVPASVLTRRLGRATLHGVVAGIAVRVLVLVGLVLGGILLVLPGIALAIFLLASFIFVRQAVALADEGFAGAIERSWRLSKGNRVELVLLLLLLGTFAVTRVVVAVVTPADTVAGPLFLVALTGVFDALGVGIVTRAYVQVEDETGESGEDEPVEDDGDDGDDENEWNDPPGVDI